MSIGRGRHLKRLPKTPTKRGTTHGVTGRKPSSAHREVAEQMGVECGRCGRIGPLENVRWWPEIHGWIGDCTCKHSPTFTVPLAEFFDR